MRALRGVLFWVTPASRSLRSLPLKYLALVGLPLAGLAGILQVGRGLAAPLVGEGSATLARPALGVAVMPKLPLLLAQIIVIIIAARLVGIAVRRLRQPQVVGEMLAGILLGPSVLGWLAPTVSATLFPAESLGFLSALSQVGLLVFMFLVGLELDPAVLRERGHAAVVTSHASIIAPFLLGAALALVLYPRLSDASVPFSVFALFMGAAMSVTAFPVLARILTERQLLRTKLGAIAIACAAVDDVTAWCILAAVVVLARAGEAAVPLWLTLGGTAAYIALMVVGARRALAWLARAHEARGALTPDLMAVIVVLVLASAWVTEMLGIHALFGAFLMGAVMPKDAALVRAITDRLEDVMLVLLLPLFFAFTGLRTSIGLIHGSELWLYCAAIVAVAVAGKLGGSALAARAAGMPWREAGAIGILMNTRGLMELVILNIGLDLGVISPVVFAMMVLMALATTFMTTPLLEWLYPLARTRHVTAGAPVPTAAAR